MASSKEKNTNYKYKIVMTYTQSNGKAIKIKCINCGREVMLERLEFNKKLKKVLGDNEAK